MTSFATATGADARLGLTAAVALHLVVAAVHGVAHSLVPVWLGPVASVAVLATTFVGPVAGVAMAWRGHSLGAPVVAASTAGAFLVGVVLHFLVSNPDHVHAIPAGAWRLPFQTTALAVAATSGFAALVAVRTARHRRSPGVVRDPS